MKLLVEVDDVVVLFVSDDDGFGVGHNDVDGRDELLVRGLFLDLFVDDQLVVIFGEIVFERVFIEFFFVFVELGLVLELVVTHRKLPSSAGVASGGCGWR